MRAAATWVLLATVVGMGGCYRSHELEGGPDAGPAPRDLGRDAAVPVPDLRPPPVDLGWDAGPDAGPPDAAPPDAEPPVCLLGTSLADVAVDVVRAPRCAAWNSLEALPGDARLARGGDELTIDFGEGVVFQGTVEDDGGGGEWVRLIFEQLNDWSDGCTWRATETLDGRLAPDCTLVLDYDYRESVAVSDGRCAGPCTASGEIQLRLTPLP